MGGDTIVRSERMFSNIGIPGLILILVLALIIFGPKKLPEIGRAVGQTLQEFKKSSKGILEEESSNPENASKTKVENKA